jgi:hypothetical protein
MDEALGLTERELQRRLNTANVEWVHNRIREAVIKGWR